MALIFAVDDDPEIGGLIKAMFEDKDHEVVVFGDGKQCLERLDENPSVVFLDMAMPVMDGMETLQSIKDVKTDLPVIMVTGVGDSDSVVKAIKLGAFDYILKPFDELRLFSVFDKAIEQTTLAGQVRYLQDELNRVQGVGRVVGTSKGLTDTLEKVQKVGASNAGVLLLGESGTGKELMARAIHENSHFSKGLFVDINCGAIPENLQESELFGHNKGSFTGATETRKGRLELADGGSLFLDEVAEMSLSTQVKLLRYLQEKSFERVGGTKKIFTNTRIIAATNKDLNKMVNDGSFREDLYYRLAVFPITIPALRERKDDIPCLVAHFMGIYKKEFEKEISSISPKAMDMLMNYFWPGNVRELGNVIYHAMIMAETNCIEVDNLPENIKGNRIQKTHGISESQDGSNSGNIVDSFEESVRKLLQRALDMTNGDIPTTAKRLKLSRSSFYRMVQKYGLTKPPH